MGRMENPSLEEPSPTNPNSAEANGWTAGPGSPDPDSPKKTGRRLSWPVIAVLGVLGLLVIAAASAFGGYQSGIGLRTASQATQDASNLQEQITLAQQDLANGQYDRARQRFEYVARLNPNYPGIVEALANLQIKLDTKTTPTPAFTPTPIPTPDTRSQDELYTQAQQNLTNKEWSKAIDALLTLRKNSPNAHPVEVDGMLFIALRNQGMEKITKTDLEGGMYDLSLAERFGPLDTEAVSMETWVSMYITGASFWELDWKQAVDYFSQVGPAMPSLTDGTGLTAHERYRQALLEYGKSIMKDDPCKAQEQIQLSLDQGPDPKGEAQPALDQAAQDCSGGNKENKPAETTTSQPGEPTQPAATAAPVETQPPAANPPTATQPAPATQPVEPTKPAVTPTP